MGECTGGAESAVNLTISLAVITAAFVPVLVFVLVVEDCVAHGQYSGDSPDICGDPNRNFSNSCVEPLPLTLALRQTQPLVPFEPADTDGPC